MAVYYVTKAFEILQEQGVVVLLKEFLREIRSWLSLTLFYQTVRLDLTTKSIKRPATGPLVRNYLKYKHGYLNKLGHIYVDPHDIQYMLADSKFVSYRYKNRLPQSWLHTPEKGSFHPQIYTGLV